MRKRTKIILGIALSGGAAIACGSGSGPFVGLDDPYDRPPNSRDAPPNSRDNPADSREKPTGAIEAAPASVDNPGSQGPGAGCPPCDGTFKCVSTVNGQMSTSTLILKSSNGICQAVDSKGKAQGAITCSGTLVDKNGAVEGMWSPAGADGFTATTQDTVGSSSSDGGTTSQMVTVTTTCTRTSTSTTTPTATTTVTATPTPTTTSTAISDAGTKG